MGTISRMHSRASARKASSRTRYRTGLVATARTPASSARRGGCPEDRAGAYVRTASNETGGSVESVAIGQRYRRHRRLRRPNGQLFGRERAVLQGKVRPDVEMDEARGGEHVFDFRGLRH